MDWMLGKGALRTVGAALLVFAAMLFAAPAPSAASSYTLGFSGTVTSTVGISGGVFAAMGVIAGDAVSGTLTIDPFNTVPDSGGGATFSQASTAFTFTVTHPGKLGLTMSDSGSGDIISVGTPGTVSGLRFSASGADSSLELTYQTDAGSAPLGSLTGLPTSAAALIALLGGASPNAHGIFNFNHYGQLVFDVALTATPIPATLPLFVSALGGLGFAAWRRRQAARAA